MSKSQNTKSEQLTEQWKKGELQSGWYWVELKEGTFVDGKKSIILDYLFEFTNDFERYPYLVEQVLAPVPSYNEWKQLKELLKECREVIKNVDTYYGNYDSTNGYLIINKIDEALR